MFARRTVALAVVVLLHGLLLVIAYFVRSQSPRLEDSAVMVAVIGDPSIAPPAERSPPPVIRPVPLRMPMPLVHVDTLPVLDFAVTDDTAAPAEPARPAAAVVTRVEPTRELLPTELAVQCPERTAPRYPPLAKSQREQGEVRLRVELDEGGRIDSVTVVSSSGSARLDEAARSAIESWRCRPAQHDGRPVRAVALQSLAFVLARH